MFGIQVQSREDKDRRESAVRLVIDGAVGLEAEDLALRGVGRGAVGECLVGCTLAIAAQWVEHGFDLLAQLGEDFGGRRSGVALRPIGILVFHGQPADFGDLAG